jgi:hypothetical protein
MLGDILQLTSVTDVSSSDLHREAESGRKEGFFFFFADPVSELYGQRLYITDAS